MHTPLTDTMCVCVVYKRVCIGIALTRTMYVCVLFLPNAGETKIHHPTRYAETIDRHRTPSATLCYVALNTLKASKLDRGSLVGIRKVVQGTVLYSCSLTCGLSNGRVTQRILMLGSLSTQKLAYNKHTYDLAVCLVHVLLRQTHAHCYCSIPINIIPHRTLTLCDIRTR